MSVDTALGGRKAMKSEGYKWATKETYQALVHNASGIISR
jgi:hypothetical protein